DYTTQLGALAKDSNDDWIGDAPYLLNGSSISYDNEPWFWDPIIFSIVTPTELTPFTNNPPNFTLDISEGIPENIWYSFDGGTTKYIFSHGDLSISSATWDTVSDGSIVIDIIMSDREGILVSDEVTLLKDATLPVITILSPVNDDEFEETPPMFEITIEEEHFMNSWYSVDNGQTTFLCDLTGSLDADLWNALPEGSVTLVFYANDTFGNIGSTTVTIQKKVLTTTTSDGEDSTSTSVSSSDTTTKPSSILMDNASSFPSLALVIGFICIISFSKKKKRNR
ncbi:MAG: hypothetical protein ACTSW1_00320, partial [Candidatus Hodarchaeales archaeon]